MEVWMLASASARSVRVLVRAAIAGPGFGRDVGIRLPLAGLWGGA